MQTHQLVPHADHPPLAVTSIGVSVTQDHPQWLTLRWRIEGAGALGIPAFAGKGRADGLWRTTCFELFLKPEGGEGYFEFNLSPSERWNAYAFDGYRAGMREAPMPRDPGCTIRRGAGLVIFDAAIPRAALPAVDSAMALTAVIEEDGCRVSYWSLAHPVGKADFHAAACFAATLPAPSDR